jgi:hypothetical protein
LAASETSRLQNSMNVGRLEVALALARKGWLERLLEAVRRK